MVTWTTREIDQHLGFPRVWDLFFAGFVDASDDAPTQRNLTCASASVPAKGR